IPGAGIGGVATAARLAKAGLQVTVLEKNDYSGGRCSLIHKDGFRFDQGPSFYLMPEIFEEMFEDLEERIQDWYKLIKCDPNYVLHYHDGEKVELSTDMTKMKLEIEKWEGKDGWARFLDFMNESHIHYEVSVKEVLHRNFPNIRSLLSLPYLLMAEKLHVFDKLYRRASNYFWTERMRRAFSFSSMYLGMSPYDSPATYNLLQYTELAQGIWYPVGGYHKVVESLERIATEKYGATFHYNSPVSSITQSADGKSATGVVLEKTGEFLEADLVVCNADLLWAYENLLPSTTYSKSLLKNPKLTCSSISFYWGLKSKVDELETHNIFLAEKYKESFDKIFDEYSLPEEPSFYVNVPTRVDPTAAPEGKETLVVLVPVGHLLESKPTLGHQSNGHAFASVSSQDWPKIIARARADVLRKLTQRFGDKLDLQGGDFGHLIETEVVNTPMTWRDNLNLYKGSILGLSHNILQVLCLRPRLIHDSIKKLYFVGASTHPGTGVPVVVCGAKLTSEQILRDLGMDIPWKLSGSPYESKVSKTEPLNQIKRPSTYWVEALLTTMLLPFLAALFVIRFVFKLDLASYFSKYEEPVKSGIKMH
ncbi:phytoene desaturase, partial [Cystobasidium minutum MCA 4210]|uniref:phytoene desaturase n=1 Tax=Cystobasidium minutum MCA 4210 TaxID=1397322 RepID=UPI0034CEADEA